MTIAWLALQAGGPHGFANDFFYPFFALTVRKNRVLVSILKIHQFRDMRHVIRISKTGS